MKQKDFSQTSKHLLLSFAYFYNHHRKDSAKPGAVLNDGVVLLLILRFFIQRFSLDAFRISEKSDEKKVLSFTCALSSVKDVTL